jgi:two-component system nitrogen regulation response regulator GlnG
MVQSISSEVLELFEAYSWPGNIRELQSVIREALIASTGPTLLTVFLPSVLRHEAVREENDTTLTAPLPATKGVSIEQFVQSAIKSDGRDIYRRALQLFDEMVLNEVMSKTEGNQSVAADLLGLSRPTLRQKLRSILAGQISR